MRKIRPVTLGFVEPMKSVTGDIYVTNNAENNWLYERKRDGYRIICVVRDGNAVLYSSKGLDVTEHYPSIKEACDAIDKNVVLDGEITAGDNKDDSCFAALQRYLNKGEGTVHFCVSDLLYLQDQPMTELPFAERLQYLQDVLGPFVSATLSVAEFSDDKSQMEARALQEGCSCIMAKLKTSVYEPGKQSRNWVKLSITFKQDLVICGFTRPDGYRKYFGSILLGIYRNNRLHYVGKCGSGFDGYALDKLFHKMEMYISPVSPFEEYIGEEITWLRPVLIGEIQFRKWTAEGKLRNATFLRLRNEVAADKQAMSNTTVLNAGS